MVIVHQASGVCNNPNAFAGLVGKVRKNLPKEEGRECGEKIARALGAWTRIQDPPHFRQGSPGAHHGGCLDKQAFLCLYKIG